MCRLLFRGLAAAAAVVLIGGCATASAVRSENDDRVITAAQIDSSGAHTAWDVVRKLLPQLNVDGGSINHRGQSSIMLTDAITVILDGARLADYHAIADIPANQIDTMRFISGIRGTTLYGLNSGDGVLVIVTKRGN